MATVRETAKRLVTDLHVDGGQPLVERWIAQRVAEALSEQEADPRRLRSTVTLPAIVTKGKAAVTQLSAAVTGDTDATAEWKKADLTGRFFRVTGDDGFYEISGSPSGELRLSVAFQGTTSASAGYEIAQRFFEIDRRARRVLSITSDLGEVTSSTVEEIN